MREEDGRGVSNLDTYIQVMQVSGEIPEELEGPELPSVLEGLWDEFVKVSNTVPAGTVGFEPLQPSQLEAWMRLTGASLSSWQIELMFELDSARRRVLAKAQEKRSPKG